MRVLSPQVSQAHYDRSLFLFAYIMTSAKYKSLYEKCNKYVLIAINAKEFLIINGSTCFYVVLLGISWPFGVI